MCIYREREVDIQYMCIMFGSNMQLAHIRSVEAKNPTCVGWPSNSTKLNPLSCVYKNSPTRPGQSEPRVGQRIRWARWESPANSSLINFKWYSHLISILPRFTNLLQTLAVEAGCGLDHRTDGAYRAYNCKQSLLLMLLCSIIGSIL